MKYLALVPLILIMGMAILPSVFAVGPWAAPTDASSNFDNYATGTVNPFPWTYTLTAGTGTGNVTSQQYHSNPYSYAMRVGSGTTNEKIVAVLNATQSSVNATIWMSCLQGASSTESGFLNVTAVTTVSVSFSCIAGTTFQAWTKESVVFAASPGATYNIVVSAKSTSYTNPATIYFDDFSIIGAAAYTSSQGGPAINFRLLNASSAGPYLFDPTGYTGSSLLVNYASANNNSQNWANAPANGLSVGAMFLKNGAQTLGAAKLITFYMGASGGSFQYSRTLIPNPSGVTSLYVDNPGSVLPYKLSIIGPAGNNTANFPQGSMIFVQQGGHNITSGYLDSTQSFLAYLVPGLYTIVLIDGSSKNTQLASMPDVSGSTVTVSVFGAAIKYNSGIVTSQTFGAQWNGALTGIVFTYVDNTSSSTWVGAVVYRVNSSGTFNVGHVYSNLSPGPGETFTGTISANSVNINKNISYELYMNVFSSSSYFGNNQSVGTMSIPIANCNTCLFGQSITLPVDILGFNILLPNVTWQNLLALFLMIATAGGFGLFGSKFGFLVLTVEAALFTAMTWLTITSALITTLPLMAITAILVAIEKGR